MGMRHATYRKYYTWAILIITTVDMICTSQILFILMVTINVLACILPAYFQYPLPPRKRKEKERFHFNVLLSIELFIFVMSIVIYCWTLMKGIEAITLFSDCILLFIKYWIITFMHMLIIIEVCNNLQSPCLVFITFILGTSMG